MDPLPGVRYVYSGGASYTQVWPDNPRGYFDETNGIHYDVNNYGFRGPDFSLRRNEAIRIAFLGDSFCWGQGVEAKDALAARIERALNDIKPLDRAYEIYNFCLPGFGTEHEAALYASVVRYFRPDMCVLWYFLNDVNEPPAIYIRGRNGQRELRSDSRLLDLILRPVNRWRANRLLIESVQKAYAPNHPGRESVARGLHRMASVARQDDVPFSVAIFPQLYRLDEEKHPFTHAHRVVEALAEREGFAVLDLLPVFAGHAATDLWVHPFDQHPNEVAHGIAARAMIPHLTSQLTHAGEPFLHAAEARRQRVLPPSLEMAPSPAWYESFAALAEKHD